MGPGEPRQPDDRGAPRPRSDDDTFQFERDDDIDDGDQRSYGDRQTYSDGPGYSRDAGYSAGARYSGDAGYTGGAGYADQDRFATGSARVRDAFDDDDDDESEITEDELAGLRGTGGPRRVLP